MTQIPNVAEETKEKIKRSSAYSLPNNPTGAGYKPQDIKNALFKPIVDGQNSVLAEVEKLIDKLNEVLPNIEVNRLELNNDKLSIVNESGETITEIELPFNKNDDAVEDIELTCDTDFKLSAKLKNSKGKVVATSNEIDLPIESLVMGAVYYEGKLILELQNGASVQVEISDLIRGLVNETDFESFQNNINGEIGNLQDGIDEVDRYATENINDLQERVSDLEQNGGSGENTSSGAITFITIQNIEEYDDYVDYLNIGDNKVYIIKNPVNELTLFQENINSIGSVVFTVGDDFEIRIISGETGVEYLNSLDVKSGETWEVSIMNNIVAAGKVVRE